MTAELQHELETAIKSDLSLNEIVVMLRQYRDQGVTQGEVYSFLQTLHQAASDDRILEISDFVAGFCAPHMKVWNS
jgi:hypothetical protein